MAEAIVASGLSRLVASIDGACQETYELYRIGGSFERATANMSRLVRAKERLSAEKPDLIWKFLIHAFNEHEMAEARRKAKQIGVQIIFGLMDVPIEQYESSVTLPVPITDVSLAPQLYYWCLQPFHTAVINFNGDLYPCCNVFGPEYALGNLHRQMHRADLEQSENGGLPPVHSLLRSSSANRFDLRDPDLSDRAQTRRPIVS